MISWAKGMVFGVGGVKWWGKGMEGGRDVVREREWRGVCAGWEPLTENL